MSAAAPAGSRGGILALVVVLLLAGGAFFALNRPVPLERSAIGFEGLGLWLARSGVAVERIMPAPDDPRHAATLRILPLFDNDAGSPASGGSGASDRGGLAPRPMSRTVLTRKLAEGTALVVLPKWREGIRTYARAHPDLLIPPERLHFLMPGNAVTRSAGVPIRDLALVDTQHPDAPPGHATVYAPQALGTALAGRCAPLWTAAGAGTLLAQCSGFLGRTQSFFLLSDPDLLDNHGLALGENAAVALALVRRLAPNRPVFVDGGADEDRPLVAGGADPHRASLADLERFIRYPFVLAWPGVSFAALLALWRGGRRFGQPLREGGGTALQSKRETIVAAGRLMRLSGHEGELVQGYARSRVEGLQDTLLGRRAARQAGGAEAAVLGVLRQRAPSLAARLEHAYADVTAPSRPDAAGAALPAFETVYGEILDEFGRAAIASRRHSR